MDEMYKEMEPSTDVAETPPSVASKLAAKARGCCWRLSLSPPPSLPSSFFPWQLICFQQLLIFQCWFSLRPRPCSIFVSLLRYLLSFPHV